MKEEKYDIKSRNPAELAEFVTGLGEKSFRAKQIFDWLHAKQVSDFEEMKNLPKNLIQTLSRMCAPLSLKQETVQISEQDGTRKYLFMLPDGNRIESVLMRYRHGNAVCISSQAGCRMGCRFCASTQEGLARGLTPSEMLDQVYQIGKETGERVSSVVVMGIGEPLDNFDSLVRFTELLTHEDGLHLSQRNLTVSTCGLVPEIRKLAEYRFSLTLAVSLHAAVQEKRRQLIPVADRYPLPELMEACQYYFEQTGRRVTFEYSLIAGFNDTDADADALAGLLRGLRGGMRCHVNLIPVNPVRGRAFRQPHRAVVAAFKNKLEKNGINVTIRREMGRDIDGACGQLRRRYAQA